MPTFILGLALQCFFPLFQTGSGEFQGLSLLNTAQETRDLSITATAADGGTSQTAQLKLLGNEQRAVLVKEIFSPAPSSGWLRVDSVSSNCPVYLATGDEDTLGGYEAAANLSSSIVLPHIEVNTGFVELNYSDTVLSILNPGSNSGVVSAELFGLDGSSVGTVNINLPARGSSQFRVSESFASFLPNNSAGGKNFQGYIRLKSTVDVAAWQRVETPLALSVLRGTGAQEMSPTRLGLIPHFAFSGDLGSSIDLINPSTSPVNLELSAHNDQGIAIGETRKLTLGPGEAKRSPVGGFFRVPVPLIFPPPLITGSIRIREASGQNFQIVGDIQNFAYKATAQSAAMLSPISQTGSTTWVLPFGASIQPFFTAYAIAAANDLLAAQTDATVEVVGSDGKVINRTTTSISPRGRVTATIPAGLGSGYVRITSNLPVHVLGSIGTTDTAAFDQISSIRF
jgi:hypothetical protein